MIKLELAMVQLEVSRASTNCNFYYFYNFIFSVNVVSFFTPLVGPPAASMPPVISWL